MLKKVILRWISTVLAIMLLSSSGFTALAQQVDEGVGAAFSIERVGVIDLGEILRKSHATINVRDLLDAKREEFQEQFAAREVELLSREKSLKGVEVMSKV